MTSTEFTIGMSEGRNSSKVLKPPGGGSSDIFSILHYDGDTPAPKVSSNKNVLGDDKNEPGDNSEPSDNKNEPADNKNEAGEDETADNKEETADNKDETVDNNEPGDNENEPSEAESEEQSKAPEVNSNTTQEPKAVKPNPKKYVRRNPITGEIIETDMEKNENNNETNGSDKPNGNAVVEETVPEMKPLKPTSVRVRQPPGGKSSGIF